MECGWYAYQSKSGETLFFFNKITGQYRWLSCSCSKNLEPWIPDVNSFKGIASEVIEYDKPDNMTSVHVRSIATETDLPAARKTLNTQGTQTECLDDISCTDDPLSQNVLSTIILNNSNHKKVLLGDNSKPVLSRNTFLLQENNSSCKCRGEENCNGSSTESKQTYKKVKLFECSYCEKAFTSYAFLVKHEKYHVENDSQKKVCDDLEETRSVNSISFDPEVEQEETKKNCHLMKGVTKQNTVVSTLINTPPSTQADSIPFFQACFQCGKSCTMSDEFDSHLQEHLKEQFCNPCRKSFKDANQFMKHICSYHVTLRRKCHLCKGKYLLKSSLTNHLWHFHKVASNDEEERGAVSYSQKCGSCEASFKLSDKLMEHQRAMKHKGIKYQCHGCGKLYAVLIDLQQHLIQEHNLDSQSTSSSLSSNSHKKPSQHKESLIKKIKSLDSVQPDRDAQRYWCNECGVSYTWSCDLVKHKIKKRCCLDRPIVQMIGNSQHYICSYCDRPFDDKEQFGKHYVNHFKKNTPINCDRCTKTFSTFQSLENHFAVHLEEKIKEANNKGYLKPYSCEECGKSFGTVRNLRRHIKRNHTKEKQDKAMGKFCCDICNKVYSHGSTLSTHKKTHSVQNNSFPQRAAQTSTSTATEPVTKLKRPAEINANKNGNLRKFKCNKCHRTFFNAECLSRHKKLLNHGIVLHLRSSHVANTVEEPKSRSQNIYNCQVCKKSFKYYNMFYKHRSAHKVEKVRRCTICGKFFKVNALSSQRLCLSCKKAPPKITKDFFSCNICGKAFLESRSLKGHMQAHSKGHFDCMSCSIAFSSAERLNEHMRNHKNEVRKLKNFKSKFKGKFHECNNCQKLYSSRKSLVRHRKICMRKENNQPGSSPVNIAVKKNSVGKKAQKKNDKNNQNYSCQKCQKSFVLFSEFYSHCSEHGEEKPCCKCDKLLSSSSSLKRHLTEIHSGDHTFYCHICSEEFYSLNGLVNHITLVPGAKRHKCNECGQVFALCNGLMDHVKTHAQ